jgi:hypothetical protein
MERNLGLAGELAAPFGMSVWAESAHARTGNRCTRVGRCPHTRREGLMLTPR